jgi:hypothetical protein
MRRWIALALTCSVFGAAAEGPARIPLPMLVGMPFAIVPDYLVPAHGSANVDVLAFVRTETGARWLNIGDSVFYATLASLIKDDAYPEASAFQMEIVNRERSPGTKLRIVFEASTTSCLVSHIDNRLVHTFSPGREIRVSSVYYRDTTRLARATTFKTLCTAFNGQLALLLGAPTSDMLQATFITYDNNGAKAAVTEMTLDFPTYAW